MGGGFLVVLADQVQRQLLRGQSGERAEEVPDVAVGAVKALGGGVDLGPVAGGQKDDLGEVRPHAQIVKGLRAPLGAERDPFQHRQRRGAVAEPDHDDGHASTSFPCRYGITLGVGSNVPELAEARRPSSSSAGNLRTGGVVGRGVLDQGRHRSEGSATLVEAQDLELDGQIDLADGDTRGAR